MAVQYILPAVLIGFVLDLILGDPVFLLHPVRQLLRSFCGVFFPARTGESGWRESALFCWWQAIAR